MRILSLRFKNLNSLAGEWKIDFTDPEYVSSGIFAITGPTGAGKSTILDAISLALYGRTPRLGKISKNAGEIMSRQTGEYFSEVEFVSDKGQYRCTWSQNRAHKKPEGDLQSPKHEIVDVKTGIPLESKQAAVQQKVTEVTGLDYQQFTRSILLAQGDFATFLDAKAEERAPILEKITGTEIYGRISVAVHERYNREKTTLDTLKNESDTIEVISPEQELEYRGEIDEHEKEIAKISAHCKNLEAAATWLDTIATLETEISRLEEQQKTVIVRRENSKKDLDALSYARKARDIEGIYSGLSVLRAQQERDIIEKRSCEEQLVGLDATYTGSLEVCKSAQEKRDTAILEKKREDEIIKKVRELDTRIRETATKQDEREEEKRRLDKQIGVYKEAICSAESRLKEIKNDLLAAVTYLETHAADQKLAESFSGIESAIRQVCITGETAEKKQEELRRVKNALADAEQILLLRNAGHAKAAKKVQDAIADANRAKKEFAGISGGRDTSALRALADEVKDRETRLRSLLDSVSHLMEDNAERDRLAEKISASGALRADEEQRYAHLQKDLETSARMVKISEDKLLLLTRVQSLEAEREKLVLGKPCPLCGSVDHPYCSGAAPVFDGAQQEHDAFKKTHEKIQKNIRECEAKRAGIDAEIRAGEAARQVLVQKIGKVTPELETECRNLGLITVENPGSAITSALDECTAKLEKARETLSRAEEKEREIRLAEDRVNKEKDALAVIRSECEKTESYRDTKIHDRDRITEEARQTDAEYASQKVAILKVLQEYGIELFSTELAGPVLSDLKKRRDGYTANLLKKQELETLQQRCEAEGEKNRSLLLAAEKSLAEVSAILSGIYADLKDHSEKRREIYGKKDPAAEEARVARIVEAAEKELLMATDTKNADYTRKTSCEDQIKNLLLKITSRIPVLDDKEREFSNALSGSGFTGEEQFLSARLVPGQLAGLEQLEADLVREEIEIATGLKERTEKLSEERERALTQEKREDLAIAIENDKNSWTALQIDIGKIRTKLEQYDDQLAKRRALAEKIAQQKKEFTKWEKLHDLIGSADGKKFRIFAQGLTFERLVVQANRHLRSMSDRYLLVRDKNSPLDLDIIDNYQAGEIRTTKNLSGGERFLVSLALALGLSGMASHNVRIDSLFLDEGFGTLDEDTLETALETLSSLRQEGKIIGIISHVPALKERIPVQIQVEKTGGGRSRLAGPGCSGPA